MIANDKIDLRNMKGVSIDEEGMSITAQGGCRAIDLETPLQELGLSVVLGAVNDTGENAPLLDSTTNI